MKTFIKHLLTEYDNVTWDVFRVVFLLSMVAYLGYTAWNVWNTKSLQYGDWATGWGVLFGAGAGGVGVKSKLEGPADDQSH